MSRLKQGIDILNQTLEKQLEFIEWLKSNELYNPMENSITMNKMYDVWAAVKNENK